MGIDLIRGGRIANRGIRTTKTTNTYIKTLIKLYAFLGRRTDAKFNQVIHKRLNQSRLNRYPISISRIVRTLSQDNAAVSEGKTKFNSRIVAVVGSVTNDNRFLNVPQGLRVCALKFTSEARNRITAAKGECLTFDQLAQLAPTGKGVLLLRGPRDREAKRHFGLCPGQRGSHTAPRVRTEGRKWERARGRR
jgi:large subunit ribosomal protein L18e